MERNNHRIDEIYPKIKNNLNQFRIYKNSSLNLYKSIIINWFPIGKNGFFISCPRDLDTNKFLCEICLVNNQGALYSLDSEIHKMLDYNELLFNFYRFYLYIVTLYNLPFALLKFYIKNKNKNHIHSLETLCKYQITTSEINQIKHFIFI